MHGQTTLKTFVISFVPRFVTGHLFTYRGTQFGKRCCRWYRL